MSSAGLIVFVLVAGLLAGGSLIWVLSPLWRGRPPLDPPEARDDGRVVAEGAVAVEFEQVVDEQVYVIRGQGAVRVPRRLDLLPGRQLGEDRPLCLVAA